MIERLMCSVAQLLVCNLILTVRRHYVFLCHDVFLAAVQLIQSACFPSVEGQMWQASGPDDCFKHGRFGFR